jgi:hypothetical protein
MLRRISQKYHTLTLLFCLILTSCSNSRSISRDELRSVLLAAISLASESELFIGQLQEDRITPAFAQGHLAYLRQEVTRVPDTLRKARADEGMSRQLESCRAQMAALALLLGNLENGTQDKYKLSADKQQIRRIRLVLEQANAQL